MKLEVRLDRLELRGSGTVFTKMGITLFKQHQWICGLLHMKVDFKTLPEPHSSDQSDLTSNFTVNSVSLYKVLPHVLYMDGNLIKSTFICNKRRID